MQGERSNDGLINTDGPLYRVRWARKGFGNVRRGRLEFQRVDNRGETLALTLTEKGAQQLLDELPQLLKQPR
jgi:hypothetical protein